MTTNNYRLFIALPIIPEHRLLLEKWSHKLKEKGSFKRWLHPDDYHITIKFLGECNHTIIPMIEKRLIDVCKDLAPFQLSIAGLGAFDSRTNTKILWAGVAGELDKLHQFQSVVEAEMQQLQFDKDKNSYCPHISLARNSLQGVITKEHLKTMPSIDKTLSWTVKEVILYQTHLGKSPSYEPIARFPFRGTS